MTREEFDTWIRQHDIKGFLKDSERWEGYAAAYAEHDVVLGILVKRLSLATKQLAERLIAHHMEARLNRLDEAATEEEEMINNLLTNLGPKE